MRFEALGILMRAYLPNSDDARHLFEAVDSSRSSLHPWVPWAKAGNRSIAESEDWIQKQHALISNAPTRPIDAETAFNYGIFDPTSGELLGGTGLMRLHPATQNAEIGYWVRADRHRQGIATRALAATLSWAFTPQSQGGFAFRRVHIFVAETNLASKGVPTKLALHLVTHTRQDRWIDGQGWVGTHVWDVLCAEWDTRQHALRR